MPNNTQTPIFLWSAKAPNTVTQKGVKPRTKEELENDKQLKQQIIDAKWAAKEADYNAKNPIINYTIPFIPSKQITLTNAGSATGATFSTNLLDSIAVNAKRAGLDLKTAIGLVTKESTLGNPTYNLKERAKISQFEKEKLEDAKLEFGEDYNEIEQKRGNRDLSEKELVNYNSDKNPYTEAIEYAQRKIWNENEDRYDFDVYYDMLKKGEGYADSQARKRLAQPRISILQKALEMYKQNPKSYNPGQSNYTDLVNKKAEEVWKSPQIQQWLKTQK